MITCLLVLAWPLRAAPFDTPASAGGGPPHFDVSAQFRPGKAAGAGEVAVQFVARDPDVKINTSPRRAKLDADQRSSRTRRPGARGRRRREAYLDPTLPVMFPVTVPGRRQAAPP